MAGRVRARGPPAADCRASALRSPAALDCAVRSAQLAHRERTAQRHVRPVIVEQVSRTRVRQIAAAAAGGGRQILRALSEPELFSLSAGGGELIEGPLRALQPLEVIPVEPRTTPANPFAWHLGQHHYLGYGGAAGQNLPIGR